MSEIEKQVRELFAARLKKADIPSIIRKFFDDLVDLGLKNEDIAIILQGMIDAVRGLRTMKKPSKRKACGHRKVRIVGVIVRFGDFEKVRWCANCGAVKREKQDKRWTLPKKEGRK